jgi:hypothetical protein
MRLDHGLSCSIDVHALCAHGSLESMSVSPLLPVCLCDRTWLVPIPLLTTFVIAALLLLLPQVTCTGRSLLAPTHSFSQHLFSSTHGAAPAAAAAFAVADIGPPARTLLQGTAGTSSTRQPASQPAAVAVPEAQPVARLVPAAQAVCQVNITGGAEVGVISTASVRCTGGPVQLIVHPGIANMVKAAAHGVTVVDVTRVDCLLAVGNQNVMKICQTYSVSTLQLACVRVRARDLLLTTGPSQCG